MKYMPIISETIRPLKKTVENVIHEPYGTHEWIQINRIIVPPEFLATTPQVRKVKLYCNRFIQRGFIDKPITVHKNYDSDKVLLTDGYIRYLICRLKEMEYVPVRYERAK